MTLATQGLKIGAHYPIPPGGDMLEAINLWEQQVDRRMDIVNHFRKWGAPSGQWSKNTLTSLQQACGQGRTPMITWMRFDGPVRRAGSSRSGPKRNRTVLLVATPVDRDRRRPRNRRAHRRQAIRPETRLGPAVAAWRPTPTAINLSSDEAGTRLLS
jgi:hypothetical protein